MSNFTSSNELAPAGQQKRAFTLASLSALALSACGGSGTSSVTTDESALRVRVTPPLAPVVIESTRFAYVANAQEDTISVYRVDGVSGELLPTGYASVPKLGFEANPSSLAVDRVGEFLFTTNSFEAAANMYRIDPINGRLVFCGSYDSFGNTGQYGASTYLGVSPVEREDDIVKAKFAGSVVTHPTDRRFVYMAASSRNLVCSFLCDPVLATLTLTGTQSTGTNPQSIAIHPSGKFAYVVNFGSGNVSIFAINPATGVLSLAFTGGLPNPHPASVNPYAIAIVPSGRYAYTSIFGQNAVGMYEINQITGALNWLSFVNTSGGSSSAVDSGVQPKSLAVHPSGKYVYIANYGSDNIYKYVINSDGLLDRGNANGRAGVSSNSPQIIATAVKPTSIAIDPTGRFAYVTSYAPSYGPGTVSTHLIDAATGNLSAALDYRALNWGYPTALVLTPGVKEIPRPNFAYVVNKGANTVSMFRVDAASGALVPIKSSGAGTNLPTNTITAGTAPVSIAVHPNNQFAYVANEVSGSVSCYKIARSTGLLSLQATVVGTGVNASGTFKRITVNPSGKQCYVVDSIDGAYNAPANTAVWTYDINESTGALTFRSKTSFLQPASVALNLSNPLSLNPVVFAAHPSGQFGYVLYHPRYPANELRGGVFSQRLRALDGGFDASSNRQQDYPQPSWVDSSYTYARQDMVIHRSGRFAYLIDITGEAHMYKIDPITGYLSTATGQTFGSNVTGLLLHPNGAFLYVCGGSSSSSDTEIKTYKIDARTGRVTLASATASGFVGRFEMAIDATGRFLYALEIYPASQVSVYEIDEISGALSPLPGLNQTGLNTPVSIAMCVGETAVATAPPGAL